MLSDCRTPYLFVAEQRTLVFFSFGPTDAKFVTASDDGTVRVWDFLRCHEEHILRGHGADVKQVQEAIYCVKKLQKVWLDFVKSYSYT